MAELARLAWLREGHLPLWLCRALARRMPEDLTIPAQKAIALFLANPRGAAQAGPEMLLDYSLADAREDAARAMAGGLSRDPRRDELYEVFAAARNARDLDVEFAADDAARRRRARLARLWRLGAWTLAALAGLGVFLPWPMATGALLEVGREAGFDRIPAAAIGSLLLAHHALVFGGLALLAVSIWLSRPPEEAARPAPGAAAALVAVLFRAGPRELAGWDDVAGGRSAALHLAGAAAAGVALAAAGSALPVTGPLGFRLDDWRPAPGLWVAAAAAAAVAALFLQLSTAEPGRMRLRPFPEALIARGLAPVWLMAALTAGQALDALPHPFGPGGGGGASEGPSTLWPYGSFPGGAVAILSLWLWRATRLPFWGAAAPTAIYLGLRFGPDYGWVREAGDALVSAPLAVLALAVAVAWAQRRRGLGARAWLGLGGAVAGGVGGVVIAFFAFFAFFALFALETMAGVTVGPDRRSMLLVGVVIVAAMGAGAFGGWLLAIRRALARAPAPAAPRSPWGEGSPSAWAWLPVALTLGISVRLAETDWAVLADLLPLAAALLGWRYRRAGFHVTLATGLMLVASTRISDRISFGGLDLGHVAAGALIARLFGEPEAPLRWLSAEAPGWRPSAPFAAACVVGVMWVPEMATAGQMSASVLAYAAPLCLLVGLGRGDLRPVAICLAAACAASTALALTVSYGPELRPVFFAADLGSALGLLMPGRVLRRRLFADVGGVSGAAPGRGGGRRRRIDPARRPSGDAGQPRRRAAARSRSVDARAALAGAGGGVLRGEAARPDWSADGPVRPRRPRDGARPRRAARPRAADGVEPGRARRDPRGADPGGAGPPAHRRPAAGDPARRCPALGSGRARGPAGGGAGEGGVLTAAPVDPGAEVRDDARGIASEAEARAAAVEIVTRVAAHPAEPGDVGLDLGERSVGGWVERLFDAGAPGGDGEARSAFARRVVSEGTSAAPSGPLPAPIALDLLAQTPRVASIGAMGDRRRVRDLLRRGPLRALPPESGAPHPMFRPGWRTLALAALARTPLAIFLLARLE